MKPLIGITMGDPAGVGPETIVQAWAGSPASAHCRAVVLGHPEVLRRAADILRLPLDIVEVNHVDEAGSDPGSLACLRCVSDDATQVPPGEISSAAGEAAYAALTTATDLALAGRLDAVTTAPLNKAALQRAGHNYPGHTEILAERCSAPSFAMMLYLADAGGPRGLGVVHVTLHMALRQVFEHLSSEAIVEKAQLLHQAMQALSGEVAGGESHAATDQPPRLAAVALNPHAGEDGIFGREEIEIIQPAVAQARSAGMDLVGPLGADSVFPRAATGEFDGLVAMYHDQGHIALKLLNWRKAVNITLGLPIVRTSSAHGTAFDLAWQGKAIPDGMIESLRVASQLARCRIRQAV